jgi:hypothetical protein
VAESVYLLLDIPSHNLQGFKVREVHDLEQDMQNRSLNAMLGANVGTAGWCALEGLLRILASLSDSSLWQRACSGSMYAFLSTYSNMTCGRRWARCLNDCEVDV